MFQADTHTDPSGSQADEQHEQTLVQVYNDWSELGQVKNSFHYLRQPGKRFEHLVQM